MERPPIPPRFSSLLPGDSQEAIREQRTRNASYASQVSAMSTSSTISEFLEAKLQYHEGEADLLEEYRKGFQDARNNDEMTQEELQDALKTILTEYKPHSDTINVLKRQRRIIEEDLEDNVSSKRPRDETKEPDIGLLERYFADTMVTRVMAASKQKKSTFKQSRFRKSVVDYYKADGGDGLAWCHLTGWHASSVVKAAHLVPKFLSSPELSHLFGVDDLDISYNPRNGITLHGRIEEALDSGDIVIFPIPSDNCGEAKWKCLLVNEEKRNEAAYAVARDGDKRELVKWGELDGKALSFRTSNQPAKRYLYFRFIVSYINAKMTKNEAFTDKLENKTEFWASPGKYLERSTLTSLARNISGIELPPSVYEDMTFQTPVEGSTKEGTREPMTLAAMLRESVIKDPNDEEKNDDEGRDEDEDNDDDDDDDGDDGDDMDEDDDNEDGDENL